MEDEGVLNAKLEEITIGLRDVGVYVDKAHWITDGEEPVDEEEGLTTPRPKTRNGHAVLVIDALVSDLAFSKRVQDPAQYDFDASFRDMAHGFTSEAFEALRQQAAEGKNIFADDEEED